MVVFIRPRSESSLSSTNVIPPPPDIKPIIDKLAEYVARNGSAFEQSIRTKNDPRFGFLERDHIHYNYYQLKVQLCAVRGEKNSRIYFLYIISSRRFFVIKPKRINVVLIIMNNNMYMEKVLN